MALTTSVRERLSSIYLCNSTPYHWQRQGQNSMRNNLNSDSSFTVELNENEKMQLFFTWQHRNTRKNSRQNIYERVSHLFLQPNTWNKKWIPVSLTVSGNRSVTSQTRQTEYQWHSIIVVNQNEANCWQKHIFDSECLSNRNTNSAIHIYNEYSNDVDVALQVEVIDRFRNYSSNGAWKKKCKHLLIVIRRMKVYRRIPLSSCIQFSPKKHIKSTAQWEKRRRLTIGTTDIRRFFFS